jgi:AraC-like DNA-binding protein
MRFPRSQIMPRLARPDDICMRPIQADTPALSFLTGYVGIAQDNRSIADAVLQRAFVDHMYDLFALAVGATRDAAQEAQRGGLQAARLHAIKQDIGSSLGDPALSVAALAARHACTARLIQRLFEAEGTTFTEYVLAQRLAQAHRMLTDPRHAGEKISAIALDAGFGDVSYFNRAFRRQYGAAPSDVRAHVRRDN